MTTPTQEQIQLLPKDFQLRLAVFAAELVLDKVEPQYKVKASKAIEVTKLYLEGKATQEDCRLAADANAAGYVAGYAAAYAAAFADAAAFAAAGAAAFADAFADAAAVYAGYAVRNASLANPKVIPKIVAYYEELRDFDKNFERDILGGKGG